ncbi:bifunctional protein subfamily protein [Cystoisospora suis]|uniref:Bifunctional protein subfamily protein n=1 Tax=Cystoisospora suis TaxID=483139 RepID=A0A2C6KDI2_9APIC|nr:bifunctional protein subfamily protein [Cystoisospora suis]
MISEEALVSLYNRVIQAAEELSVSLSFFEIAFSYFSEEEVDWAVIETGLGGRLDATNIIPSPRCTIITSIGKKEGCNREEERK